MSLGAPWGLLALLALPLIVAIHLFRRRFAPRPVAGLFLWGDARLAPAAGRRRQRLVGSVSLVAELVAALALTWFLCDPHLGARERARHLIVVLDDRARLQATRPDGRSVADALRAALDERLAALDGDDRVTLVTSGRPARLLAGPATTPAAAAAALAGWQPAGAMVPLDDALGVAVDLVREAGPAAPTANLLVVSDREPPGLADTVGLLTRGVAQSTSGLADARWVRDGGDRVALRVVAHGAAAARTLVVQADGRELARRALALAPEEATSVVVDLGAAAVPEVVTVALLGADPLAVDDAVTLVRPALREVRVALALDAPALTRALAAVDGVRLVTDASEADLVALGEATPPPADAAVWTLRLAPGTGAVVLGPFLAARGDAVLRGVDFTGVVWVGAPTADEADADGEGLVLAGEAPLMTARRLGRGRHFTLHVDLARSNLADHPAWPALVANLIEARRAALPGVLRANVPIGQETRALVPVGATAVRLVAAARGEAGEAALELAADANGEALIPPFERAGAYQLTVVGGGDVLAGLAAAAAAGALRGRGHPARVDPWPTLTPEAAAAAAGALRGRGHPARVDPWPTLTPEAAAAADPAAPWARINAILVDPELGDLRDAVTLDRAPTDVGEGLVERRRGPAAHLLPLLVAALAGLVAWWAWRREDGPGGLAAMQHDGVLAAETKRDVRVAPQEGGPWA